MSWRVMTWNIRGSARPDLARIASVIREQRPDVVALQEVRRAQARSLAETLGWRHRWARKHHPYTPVLWWLAEGLAILTPHDLSHPVRLTLSPGVSTWTFRHRVVLAATVHRENDSIRLYDTHLAAHRQPDERIAQAARLAGIIESEQPAACVVAGDLNAAGEVEVVRAFHPVGLRDPGGGPTHPSMSPRVRFDYVLVPDTSRALERWEPNGGDAWRELSDHIPILVEIDLDQTRSQ